MQTAVSVFENSGGEKGGQLVGDVENFEGGDVGWDYVKIPDHPTYTGPSNV